MIFLYRIAFLPLFLFAMPYYAWRMLRRGGYSKDFSHRFGLQKNLPPPQSGKTRIWIQAVSVGEVEAISAILKLLHESGRYEIVVTTTTSTAYKILREKYSQYCILAAVFPFDFYLCNKSAWKRIKPDICALMEGELWPEHMHRAKAQNVPLLLLNARLSDKTFRRYQKIPRIAKRLLSKIDYIAASGTFDMERFIKLGVDPKKIATVGNLKFDSVPDKFLDDSEKQKLKEELGFEKDSPVMLGSSTWQGEEELLARCLKKIGGGARLLLVPRHAERRDEVRAVLQKQGLAFHFRSDAKQAPANTQIYVADTTGELRMFTQIADWAFVGKSLAPNVGGQTPIDCAACGVPMAYGPNMTNFRLICRALEESQAALKAEGANDAEEKLALLAANAELRASLGERAKAWHSSNVGASLRTLEIIERFSE